MVLKSSCKGDVILAQVPKLDQALESPKTPHSRYTELWFPGLGSLSFYFHRYQNMSLHSQCWIPI